jgi:hypothetical protein
MGQEDIYRILLEIKADTGSLKTSIEEHKEAIVDLYREQSKSNKKHEYLKEDFTAHKSKFLLAATGVGVVIGGFFNWLIGKH